MNETTVWLIDKTKLMCYLIRTTHIHINCTHYTHCIHYTHTHCTHRTHTQCKYCIHCTHYTHCTQCIHCAHTHTCSSCVKNEVAVFRLHSFITKGWRNVHHTTALSGVEWQNGEHHPLYSICQPSWAKNDYVREWKYTGKIKNFAKVRIETWDRSQMIPHQKLKKIMSDPPRPKTQVSWTRASEVSSESSWWVYSPPRVLGWS